MSFITREDAELMRTFTLSLKMKNHEKVVEHFKNKFEQDKHDKKNAYNYGMCMVIYIVTDPNDSDKTKHLFAINESFSICLEQEPEWWLPRYLRSEINDGFPDEAFGESDAGNFAAMRKIDPQKDRQILKEQQKASLRQFSYFLCPYIAQARAFIRKGNIDEAVEIYREGTGAVQLKTSPFNLAYLSRPFYDTILLLRKLDRSDIADEIKKDALILFPKAKNICMA